MIGQKIKITKTKDSTVQSRFESTDGNKPKKALETNKRTVKMIVMLTGCGETVRFLLNNHIKLK